MSGTNDERVRKVAAVLVRPRSAPRSVGYELLVFEHPLEEGGFMVQLPAGTVEVGESPEAAAGRELFEETGVRGRMLGLAGVKDEFSQDQDQRRWVYVFESVGETPDEWPFSCDCGVPIRCYWLPLERASLVAPQQGWLQMARNWMTR